MPRQAFGANAGADFRNLCGAQVWQAICRRREMQNAKCKLENAFPHFAF
jgi:hypothetical protein